LELADRVSEALGNEGAAGATIVDIFPFGKNYIPDPRPILQI